MKKEIVEVDKKRGVYKITTTDERFYTIESKDEKGLPYFKFVPSCTWICSYTPKGIAYYKWLANNGWDEAQALMAEAGSRGSKMHKGIENLIAGETVKMEDLYQNNETEEMETLTPEEYKGILSFKSWYDEVKPKTIKSEVTVISKKYNFAGTVDYICEIDGETWIIDFKSSQYIWPSTEAQLSAYKYAVKEELGIKNAKIAVLQIGYNRNKKGWKFTEIKDKFEILFLSAKNFWFDVNEKVSPKQIELPLEIKLTSNKQKNARRKSK